MTQIEAQLYELTMAEWIGYRALFEIEHIVLETNFSFLHRTPHVRSECPQRLVWGHHTVEFLCRLKKVRSKGWLPSISMIVVRLCMVSDDIM